MGCDNGAAEALHVFSIDTSHYHRGANSFFPLLGSWQLHLNLETVHGPYHLPREQQQSKQQFAIIKNTLSRFYFSL